jgi:hypothetical protein
MDQLWSKLSAIAAVVATAVVNLVNSFVLPLLPAGAQADAKTLITMGVLAVTLYISNRATAIVANRGKKPANEVGGSNA